MRRLVTTLAVGGALGAAVLPAGTAGADPSPFKDACKDGGYSQFSASPGGAPFRNQGQCVSAANHGPIYPTGGGGPT